MRDSREGVFRGGDLGREGGREGEREARRREGGREGGVKTYLEDIPIHESMTEAPVE